MKLSKEELIEKMADNLFYSVGNRDFSVRSIKAAIQSPELMHLVAEELGYVKKEEVKNVFKGQSVLHDILQVGIFKNEDGMSVVKYLDKPNGGSTAYIRYDALVNKLNGLLNMFNESEQPKQVFVNPEQLKEVDGWISVEDRLPEKLSKFGDSDYILCLTRTSEQVVCWCNRDNNFIVANYKADSIPLDSVTHWQPLPNPPKLSTN